MTYRISGLSPDPFRHLFGLPDDALAQLGAQRWTAQAGSRLPDRVELRDAAPGETLILVNHEHQPAPTPYRSAHAVFVIEHARQAYDRCDVVPEAMRSRMLSLRAFGPDHFMVDAALVAGLQAEAGIIQLLANPAVDYIHAHYATRGCYAARIDRD